MNVDEYIVEMINNISDNQKIMMNNNQEAITSNQKIVCEVLRMVISNQKEILDLLKGKEEDRNKTIKGSKWNEKFTLGKIN